MPPPLICTWMKTGDYDNEPLFARGCIFSAGVRHCFASDQDDATDSAFKRRRDSMEMQQVGFDHDDLRARPRRSSGVVQLTSRHTNRPHPEARTRAPCEIADPHSLPASSLRKQGPIRRGGCCLKKLVEGFAKQSGPVAMGPCFRRDDDGVVTNSTRRANHF